MLRTLIASLVAALFISIAPVGFSTSVMPVDQAYAGPVFRNTAKAGALWTSRGVVQGGKRKASEGVAAYFAGKPVTSVENAFGHFMKHGKEFPKIPNAKQYVDAARKMINSPPPGTLTKVRPNGDRLFYHPPSNTFTAARGDGSPRTMFKPGNGPGYWKNQ